MPNIIRAAQKKDIPRLVEILHAAFTKYQKDLHVPAKVSALSENEEILLNEIESKRVLLIETDGEILGSVRYGSLKGNIAYLSRFGVDPKIHKNGVGQELIEFVIAECREKKFSAIALHTCSTMKHLIKFYYSNDFYIHSTSFDRGYIRALLLHDIEKGPYELTEAMKR